MQNPLCLSKRSHVKSQYVYILTFYYWISMICNNKLNIQTGYEKKSTKGKALNRELRKLKRSKEYLWENGLGAAYRNLIWV